MSSPVSNSGTVTGLKFVSYTKGKISFTVDGWPFVIMYNTEKLGYEDLEWEICGSFDDSTWYMVWHFDDSQSGVWCSDTRKENIYGGKMMIVFTSSSGKRVEFMWSNYHDGYFCHSIMIDRELYQT